MDSKCLIPGDKFKEGFCNGIVNSRAFVSVMSRNANNNPSVDKHNYSKLEIDSPCDHVLLEQALALELYEMGYMEKIFPVFVGDLDPNSGKEMYGDYFKSGCLPDAPDICVKKVLHEVKEALTLQQLGFPLQNRTVKEILEGMKAHEGGFISGK